MSRFYNIGRTIELNKESNIYKVGSLSNQYELSYFEYLYWKNIKNHENHEEYITSLEKSLNDKKRKVDFDVKSIHEKLINLNLISEMNIDYEDDLIDKLYVKSLFNNFYVENDNYYVNINDKKYRLNYSFVTTMTTHPFTIKELSYLYKGAKDISLEESFNVVLDEIKEALLNDLITIEYFDKESLKKEIPYIDFNGIQFDKTNQKNKENKDEVYYYIGGASIYKNKATEKELVYLDGQFKTTTTLEYVLSEGIKSKSIKKESLMKILEVTLNVNEKSINEKLNTIIEKGLLVPIVKTPNILENRSIFLEYSILPKGQVTENKSVYLSDGKNIKLTDKELLLYMNSYPELSVFETAILMQKEKQIPMDGFIYVFFDILNSLLSKEIITLVKLKKN